jgi:hypothetical protein
MLRQEGSLNDESQKKWDEYGELMDLPATRPSSAPDSAPATGFLINDDVHRWCS